MDWKAKMAKVVEDRNRRIRDGRKSGLTLREIAAAYGLSYERIRVICNEEPKRRKTND